MGYQLEFNCLLRIPNKDQVDVATLEVGKRYTVTKDGQRLYPLGIAIEICDADYKYYGKVAVHKLNLEKGKTTLEFEVIKIFSDEEKRVYNDNFIKPIFE